MRACSRLTKKKAGNRINLSKQAHGYDHAPLRVLLLFTLINRSNGEFNSITCRCDKC